jgi:hypothetical protein
MEALDDSLLNLGVDMTYELDVRFGLEPKITLGQV